MRLIVIAAASPVLVTSSNVTGQEPAKSCLTVPSELNGYRLTDTKVFDDSTEGTSYRYKNGSSDLVTMFIYPISPAARRGSDVRDWVAAEGQGFKEVFPAGVQRGWWQEYTAAFDHPDSVLVGTEQIPGYLVAGVTRRGNVVNVELEYLFEMCDRFVKVRGTLASATWNQSLFSRFAKDAVAYLRQH